MIREEQNALLLEALENHPRGERWLLADAVHGSYLTLAGIPRDREGWDHPDYMTVQGVGQRLSRLARERWCEVDHRGGFGHYRAIGPGLVAYYREAKGVKKS